MLDETGRDMRALRGLIGGAVASMMPLLPLNAAEPSLVLPPVDAPGVWHVLTRDGPGTTSRCIGDRSSAWCTLETYLACTARHQRALCQDVAPLKEFDIYYQPTLSDRQNALLYRIIWSQQGAPEGMEEPNWGYYYENELDSTDPMFREAIYIELLWKECATISGDDCDKPNDFPFLLAPVGNRWTVFRASTGGSRPFRSLSLEGRFPLWKVTKPFRPRGGAPTLSR
jgi:hypothetical protein